MRTIAIHCFADPQQFCQSATPAKWTQLLQEGRDLGLTAQLYALFKRHNLWQALPSKVQQHLSWGWRFYLRQRHALFFELQQLEPSFVELDYPVLLLKGAAYQALGLTAAEGRLFSDIDLLVDRSAIQDCKGRLFMAGFYEAEVSAYDRFFYLTLSHECPPLVHVQRSSSIDLHFNIFPLAGRKHLNIEYFIQQRSTLSGSGFATPSLAMLFIHAAIHFYWQEESHKMAKDLVDLFLLAQQCQQLAAMDWVILESKRLGACEPVINCLLLLEQHFSLTLQPTEIAREARLEYQCRFANYLIGAIVGKRAAATPARWLWYLRGYLHKMTLPILLKHSMHKFISWLKRPAAVASAK